MIVNVYEKMWKTHGDSLGQSSTYGVFSIYVSLQEGKRNGCV